MPESERIWNSIDKLWNYCHSKNFAGYDPEDILNSPVLRSGGRYSRRAAVSLLGESPINFRDVLSVREEQNPTALGVFLSVASEIYKDTENPNFKAPAYYLLETLFKKRSPDYTKYCWGENHEIILGDYSIPKFTPNIISSTVIGNGFIDAYEAFGEPEFLKVAYSIADFIKDDIYRTPFEESVCFSFSPIDKTMLHCANIIGAAFLSRTVLYSDSHEHAELAYRSAQFTADFQNPDGGWYNMVEENPVDIDNLNMALTLKFLKDYIAYSSRPDLNDKMRKGIDYYMRKMFTSEGIPKFKKDRTYPVDIRSCSQAVITLCSMRGMSYECSSVLEKCFDWVFNNMRHPDGYFYYRKNRFYTNRAVYMERGQAWMLKALLAYYDYAKEFEYAEDRVQIRDGYRLIFEGNNFTFEKVES
ncbi:MAG: hypothetical protein GF307_08700 [candidate division Zixibacteria bacterium]|nr:hypothetical protein [candidate division Zixibacteria bacterium]